MTTNGSFLYRYAENLKLAGIDLVRISWHSMDDKLYRIITGGGKLSLLLDGLEKSVDCNLPMSINRVLMNGYLDDLQAHIEYIDKYKLRLKLLDLYWTEDSKNDYEEYYISPDKALERISPNLLTQDNTFSHSYGRNRVRYITPQGGIVEYKLKETVNRPAICDNCHLKSNCLEGFGDYLRLYPDGKAALCYLRDDLAVEFFNSNDEFQLNNEFYHNCLSQFIHNIPLRLVLEGRCNFNCGFPTSKKSWCLKQGKGFFFPTRKEIIIKNVE